MKAIFFLLIALTIALTSADTFEGHKYWQVLPFDRYLGEKLFDSAQDTIYLFIGFDEAGRQANAVFTDIAAELNSKVAFCLVKFEEEDGKLFSDFLTVRKEDLPTFRIVRPLPKEHRADKYRYNRQDITVDNIRQFIDDFQNNRLKPYSISQPIPASPYDGNVRIIVADNFEEVVFDDTKDVLVDFYADNCGYCQQMAPTYKSLAAKLKDYEDIVIAKIDAYNNEILSARIQGFPTIRLYPKNNKHSPIQFYDDSTEDAFISFLKQHGTVSIGENNHSSNQSPNPYYQESHVPNHDHDQGHGNDHGNDHDNSYGHGHEKPRVVRLQRDEL